ncbi:MAG TPA: hypothetical protein VIN06_06350 [Devosia sp.]
MLRLLAIITIALTTPVAAHTIDCVDPNSEVTLQIVESYDETTGEFGLVSAKFQIVDDLGYTSADDPSNDGEITLINSVQDWENLAFDMHLRNVEKGYDSIVGSIRMSRAQEGSIEAIGGTLHVSGGGAWAVTCDVH